MKKLLIGLSIGLTAVYAIAATNDVELQQTNEILGLLKTHYVDGDHLNNKSLTDATVNALLRTLDGGAQLLSAEQAKSKTAPTPPLPASPTGFPLARAEIIDPDIGYIRLADVEEPTMAAFDEELKKFSTKRVKDYLLDLRFADGTNYAAAATIAGRFLTDGQELFSIKRTDQPSQSFRAGGTTTNATLTTAPLIILVNRQTRGAAEALAGALQAQQRGMVIGNRTTGNALAWEDIPLNDGRVLRLATAKIALPKGNVFPGGITPDVTIIIDPKAEKEVVMNLATNLSLSASLQITEAHKSMKEADLVKYHRGEAFDIPTPKSSTNKTDTAKSDADTNETPPRDIVLQRAVDILKGIRVWHSWQ
jgi:hypothetical protein